MTTADLTNAVSFTEMAPRYKRRRKTSPARDKVKKNTIAAAMNFLSEQYLLIYFQFLILHLVLFLNLI